MSAEIIRLTGQRDNLKRSICYLRETLLPEGVDQESRNLIQTTIANRLTELEAAHESTTQLLNKAINKQKEGCGEELYYKLTQFLEDEGIDLNPQADEALSVFTQLVY